MTHSMTSALPDPDFDHAYYDGVPAKRLFAWVVDVLIVTLVTFLLGILTLTLVFWLWVPVYVLVAFFYRSASIAAWSGTVGMRLMNIELRSAMGRKFSAGEAMLHTLSYLVCSGFAILQVLSVVMIAMSARHQGVPDLVVGSVMINSPR